MRKFIACLLRSVGLECHSDWRTFAMKPINKIAVAYFSESKLCFIGARHGVDVADPLYHFQRDAIVSHMRDMRPKTVIVEGLSCFGNDVSKASYTSACQRFGVRTISDNCSENVFSAVCGIQQDVRVCSPDQSEEDVLSVLQSAQFSDQDIRDYMVMRRFGGVMSEMGLFEITLDNGMPSPDFCKAVHNTEDLPESVVVWLRDVFCLNVLTMSFANGLADPYGTDSVFNGMSKCLSEHRDLRLWDMISGAVATDAPVLVVYGSSHLYTLLPKLEEQFGVPVVTFYTANRPSK